MKQNIQAPPPAPTGGSETQELRNMCSYLKAELDRLKATVQSQQEEIKQYRETANRQKALAAQILNEK